MNLLGPAQPLPILAWIGPGIDALPLNERTMADLAAAGFNLSLSNIDPDDPRRALDIAKDAGVRLIVSVPGLRVRPGGVDEAWRTRMKALIEQVGDHEALYGYYIADEPKIDRFDDIATAFAFFREHDPAHLPYYNHWTVNFSWCGFHSYEEMWDTFGAMCRPDFTSADLYPFHVVDEAEWLREKEANPCYFPRHKARIDVHYYEMLEHLRLYARQWQVPMWSFTYGTYRYSPETLDGEMRIQLMMSLAYGAKGMQYFTYAHGNMMMGRDNEPKPGWHVAKALNRVLRAWEPTLKALRHIGVYHHPADLAYTRPLDQYVLGNPSDLCVRSGDDVVVGQFLDETGCEYALIVNRTPFEPARIVFHFGTDGEVEECSPADGSWSRPWPYPSSRALPLTFAPGAGRLFRFKRTIVIE